MMLRVFAIAALVMMSGSAGAFAQISSGFDAGVHVTIARIGELETNDVGVSGRLAWQPVPLVGVEGEVGISPANVPDGRAITGKRVEGVFGVTVGPRLGRVRAFARVRPGFLRVGAAPEPVACILIFPPPLSCTLAGGRTLFVTDIGGGVTFDATDRMFFRADVGDRLVRYPGPAFTRERRVFDESFIDHDLRVAVGAGWRF